ncbi:hypothetical protein HBI80_252250 [Parastagonospora nodorum]|nr:hypothetical protein HBI06_254460 [Parastagonospora nodorum]KAH4893169.1 hypothetical protein HBI80_252250 [Parastagonospora nodorum]
MVTPIAGPRIQLVNLCFHLVRHGIHKPSMSAEARPVQDRVTPFMDNAKFNSLNHNVYTAGIDQYHQIRYREFIFTLQYSSIEVV